MLSLLLPTLLLLPSTLAHPHLLRRDSDPIAKKQNEFEFGKDASIQALLEGNARFRADIASSENPELLKDLQKKGQKPAFAFIGCSDSRSVLSFSLVCRVRMI